MMDSALAGLLAPYAEALQGQPTPINPLGGLFSLMAQAPSPPSPPSRGSGGSSDAGGNRWEQLAAQMAQNKYGWGPHQFDAIDQIATAESGWNPHAVNPNGGAAGIPQALPSAHPGLVTQQWMNDPRAQISWMLNYIAGRYGTPQHALSVREHQGWY